MRSGSERLERWAPRAVWTLVVTFVLAAGVGVWAYAHVYVVHAPPGVGPLAWSADLFSLLAPFAPFAVVGAVIVSRRPRNTVGWLMLAAASAFALAVATASYAMVALGGPTADPALSALIARWFQLPAAQAGFVLSLVFVPLLFPHGHLPSPRWRLVAWVALLHVALAASASVLSPRLTGTVRPVGAEPVRIYDIANPLAIEGLEAVGTRLPTVAGLLFAGLALATLTAVIVRFRRSDGIERQQMKWFVAAVIVVPIVGITSMVMTELGAPDWLVSVMDASALLGSGAYPAAVGVAVLRYRLYEIDRIISRTVSYGLVVAVLAGVYVAGVVGLGAAVTALTGRGDSDLVVAVSTLVAAGLFRPVRTRIQTAVDRRFNRTGYEARRAVEAFTRDVRDQVDLDRIRRQVARTAAVATQPAHVSVWLSTGTDDDRE